MSRLWDTPEFWARSEADEALREMLDVEPAALADSFDESAASYDGDPAMVALIASDLRQRAVAGVRFWPAPRSTARPVSGLSGEALHAGTTAGMAELIDDEIPW